MTEKRNCEPKASRRGFLATAAATAAAVSTGLSWVPNVHAAGDDAIKVGVIGCGGRGSGAADNVLHSSENVQIVALGDVFPFRIDGLKKRLTDLAATDEIKKLKNSVDLPNDRCHVGLDAYEKVLNTPGVNYVILATPPGFRPLHLQAAVAAGKNIFTEKPVGVDGTGIRKVLAAYDDSLKKGIGIGAGTQRRHQLGYVETMKQIHGGEIGDVVACRAYWNNSHDIWFHDRKDLAKLNVKDSDLAYQLYNWYHFLWTCGDHIVEQHVHNLDVCNWAMNAHPERCIGMGGRAARQQGDPNVVGQIYDNFAIDYVYPNGVHMLSMCRQLEGGDDNVSEALVGTKGNCQANGYTINGKRILTKDQDRAATDPYVQEHTDLIASIRSGKPYNELKNVAESTLTAIMGRMATYTGKPVTWDKALNSKLDTFPRDMSWDMKLEVAAAPVPGKTPLE
jgi:predicted dehydrogenase